MISQSRKVSNKAITGHPARTARKLAIALASGTCMFALSVPLATSVQAQVSSASLRGKITADSSVSEVTAVEVATGTIRKTPVATNGSYVFASLRPGTYRLELTTPNGVKATEEFTLLVAQEAVLDFDLSSDGTNNVSVAGAVNDQNMIIVSGTRIRTLEGGEVGVNITQRDIEQLPQDNRNFLAFADLAPGVQLVDPDGQSRIQGGGQNSRTVNVFIDGIGQKDYVLKNGVTGQDSSEGNPFPQIAVGEYRVISSNYKAEFDQVSSVAITATTRSGTNEFHGEAFIDYTDTSMRARKPSEKLGPNPSEKAETKDLQFGGALGGPIIKDMLHFFVAYEGKRRRLPVTIEPGADFPVSYFPTQYQDLFGATQRDFDEDLYFGKLSFSPSDKDLFELSGKFRRETGIFLSSGSNAEESASSQDVDEKRATFRWEHSEDRWINDLKITYEDAFWSPRPQNFIPGSIFTYSGVSPVNGSNLNNAQILRIGGSANFQDKGQKGYAIQNDFTWIGIPDHTIKMGIKSKWVKLTRIEQNYLNPQYSYNVNFPAGGFNTEIPYRVQFGAATGNGLSEVISKNWQFGIYIQDDWDVTDRLTLNFGIRWDYEETPSFLDYVTPDDALFAVSEANYPNIHLGNAGYDINDYITDGTKRSAFKGAFQPRIGFTYEIDDQGRYVLFGGYGRSYDRNQFDFIAQELSVAAYSTRTFNFITGDPNNTCTASPTCVAWDPIYLTEEGRNMLLAGAGVGGGRSLRYINNDLKVPYSDQFSLGVRGQLTDLFNAEIGYRHIESHDGFAYLLGNRRPDGTFFTPPPAVPGSPFGFAPPGFGSIILGDSGLETSEDAVHLKLVKRYTRTSPWNLTATYTYTEGEENRAFNEYFSFDFPSLEDYTVKRSSGLRKHRFVMAGAVDIPWDITLSGKFQISSPKYLNNFDRIIGGEPPLVISAMETEGNGDRWGFRQMDVAMTKYIPLGFLSDDTRIKLRVDVINLFNDRNYSSFISSTGERNRNSFSTDGPPRTIKVSAGFEF